MAGKSFRVVHVFYGEETYLLDRELARVLRWREHLITLLDGATATEDRVVAALEDRALMDDCRVVVVVDNAEKIKLASALLTHVDAAKSAPDGASMLVAICRTERLSKGWLALGSTGRMVEHRRFKPWEKEKISERMTKEATLLGLTLSDGAFDVLFKVYGEQTALMVNELRKTALLLSKGDEITAELVLSLCARRSAVAPWDVSEAALAREPKRAMRALSMLYQEKGDEALIPVVAAMARTIEQAVMMRSLLDRQQGPEAIATALGVHPFRVKRELPSVEKHTSAQLIEQMNNICKLEVQAKGSSASKRTLVELAILSLAAS